MAVVMFGGAGIGLSRRGYGEEREVQASDLEDLCWTLVHLMDRPQFAQRLLRELAMRGRRLEAQARLRQGRGPAPPTVLEGLQGWVQHMGGDAEDEVGVRAALERVHEGYQRIVGMSS